MTNPVPFHVVIPARYASTRLPKKPLLDIAGKPMVVWVVERALQSGAKSVVVATDHPEIVQVVKSFGYQVVMTREDHLSGTDRIAEVSEKLGFVDDTIIVNVQGDEPLIHPELIQDVASALYKSQQAVMSTACHTITDGADFLNPNVVKVVMDYQGHALYFSRAPIPYPRDLIAATANAPSEIQAYRHVGIYAYRAQFLKAYASLHPANIEQLESLEQLRVLYQGYKIAVTVAANAPAPGVDTESDINHIRHLIKTNQIKM